jgi:hypothetical protein
MQGKSRTSYIYLFVVHRQSGDRFVVKVKPVQIKGVRMIVEHMIEALPDRKVHMKRRRAPSPTYVRLSAI